MGEVISQKGDAVYDVLIEFMEENSHCQHRNVLEVGAFCGHFTKRLAQAFDPYIVFAVDVFNPEFDKSIGHLYVDWLDGNNQFHEYQRNIAGLDNVITICCDSELMCNVGFPGGIASAYIDGGHGYWTAMSDIGLAWRNLVSGGVMVVDDYQHDLSPVTQAVNNFVANLERRHHEFTKFYLDDLHSFAIRKDEP